MKLSQKSIDRLRGVHPDLIAVVKQAIEITTQDFSVLCGVRTAEEQAELYAQGRTKPGNVVTWTLKTKHVPGADGFGHAVDLVPYPLDWNDLSKFDAISIAMMRASEELGVTIRWGADWDMDGLARERGESDSPHFEIVLT
jgi:peptidoglycan L-alanyl-D-glutamate endopeptidase CwlK